MHDIDRRQFFRLGGASLLTTALPRAVRAAAPAHVVVVGGGFGGATVARYLRLWDAGVRVTLVEPNPTHVACILSNLVVTGTLALKKITLGYGRLRNTHGVDLLAGRAVDIDADARRLTVATAGGNQVLDYDHLVLAPGVSFTPPPGTWNPDLTPHAWIAGPQTTLLQRQLAAMRNNDVFVMTIPKNPYRCPPGPYERACVVADYLKRKKRRGAQVVVLDANPGIQAEPDAFTYAFNVVHGGVIQYVPNAVVESVNSATRSIVTSARSVSNAAVLNVIPTHRAPAIAALLGSDAGGFVPVDPLTYAVAGHPDIHVIGDACAVPASTGKGVPKSGHMANSEAKVCADAILRALAGLAPDTDVATSSACFSPITSRTASWLSAGFVYGDVYDAAGAVKGKGMHRLDLGEAPRKLIGGDSYEDMFTWSRSLFADSFG